MNKFCVFVLLVFLSGISSITYAQSLSAGIYSGVNISDIHGNSSEGKWMFMPGTSQGVFVDYAFNKYLGVHSGMKYSTLYYRHLEYFNPASGVYISPVDELMDFNFLTVPLQFRVTTPSKPQVYLSAGLFYSFLTDKFLQSKHYFQEPEERDFGYVYSTGMSFPLSNTISSSFNVTYSTGRKEFRKSAGWRHGSAEFTMGLAYSGFLKNSKNNRHENAYDTISDRIYVTYRGGMNVSWNSGSYFKEKYSYGTGLSLGFAVNYKWSERYSLQTGISFERVGFANIDSSKSMYRYAPYGDRTYDLDTKTEIDYIVIPLLINLNTGRSGNLFFNTGPYLGVKLNARCHGVAIYSSDSENFYYLKKITVNDDVIGLIKDNDFGWVFGSGLALPVSDKWLIDLGLQYRAGFMNISDKSFESGFSKTETKKSILRNGSVTFQIGIRIPTLK
jgi:hypothetical protein